MKFANWLESEENKLILGPKKILILMRGLPGSGKSTITNKLLNQYGGSPDGHIFSTDNFWIPETRAKRRNGLHVNDAEEDREYALNFDLNKLRSAHLSNIKEFKFAVDRGVSPIIVDNVNSTVDKMRPYADYAEKAGYEILVKYPSSDWWKQNYRYLSDKKTYAPQLDLFAQELAKRNKHGVPIEKIKEFIAQWDHNPTLEEILGRKPTKKN